MRLPAVAIALMMATGAAQAAPCYNATFNIVRASECLSYTTDRQKQNDLRDKRTEAINEWVTLNPNGGASLDLMIKEADRRMTQALARDYGVFPDDQMYQLRGCGTLPVCVAQIQQSVTPRVRPKPVAPAVRNTRTGGTWCGPRDKAHGYCNWNGWLR